MRRADVDLVAALAVQGRVAGEHVEVPQRQAGRQARLLAEGDGLGELEVAEVGLAVFGAHAHAHEFDFGDDEAVAGVAFAHQAVQVREAGEVEGLLAVFLRLHAGVPDVVGLDDADDTAAAEGVGFVVGVGGQVEWAVFSAALRTHGDVVLVALAGLEGRVDFGGVVGGYCVLERAFVGGLDYRLVGVELGESHGRYRDIEKAGRFVTVREMGNRQNGLEAEVFPFVQIADIPPLVRLCAVSYAKLSSNQVYCLVWSR